MKHRTFLTFLLTVCLMLCACTGQTEQPTPDTPTPPVADQPVTTPTPSVPDGSADPDVMPELDTLAVELVVEWRAADALLSHLKSLAVDLQTQLEEAGCHVEHVTVTLSTAGGFTAEALASGGVDAAILPAVDFISCEEHATVIALSDESLCETAVAVTNANSALNDAFRSALYEVLTGSEVGEKLLSACNPRADFLPPTEEALQNVREYLASLEEQTDGHE